MRMLLLLIFFGSYLVGAQTNDEAEVKKTVQEFFKGFHAQDSVQIKRTISHQIVIRTVGKDETGNSIVKSQSFADFLKSIVGIPRSTQFKEVITNYSIRVDGPLAHAWTGYEFYLNGEFHHCGVNSFQLVKEHGKGWQIVYLIDTRRKGDCP